MSENYKQLIDEHIEYLKSLDCSELTIKAYRETLNDFFLNYWKERPLSELSKKEIHLYRNYKNDIAVENKKLKNFGVGQGAPIKKDKISATTMNRHFAALRGFLTNNKHHLLAKEIETLEVDQKFDVIEYDIMKIIFELEKLKEYYNDKVKTDKHKKNIDFYARRLHLIVEFVYSTGLRLAETFSVETRMLKLQNETPIDEFLIVGKGEHERKIYPSADWIKKYKEFQKDYPKSMGSKLFTTVTGESLKVGTLRVYITQLGKALGIKGLSFHKLRHCFAIKSYESHKDIYRLCAELGHKNIRTTTLYLRVLKLKREPLDMLKIIHEMKEM